MENTIQYPKPLNRPILPVGIHTQLTAWRIEEEKAKITTQRLKCRKPNQNIYLFKCENHEIQKGKGIDDV